MPVFQAKAHNGGFDLGSDYNRSRLKQFLKDNEGMRLKIEPLTPESAKQRKFFEGAIVPMICYYQEGLNYRNSNDLHKVREWLKLEFNAEYVVINGKSCIVPGTTKGHLQPFLENVLDWMVDQGYQVDLLNPEQYKYWKDVVFMNGGADTYIDYLLELGKLSTP